MSLILTPSTFRGHAVYLEYRIWGHDRRRTVQSCESNVDGYKEYSCISQTTVLSDLKKSCSLLARAPESVFRIQLGDTESLISN